MTFSIDTATQLIDPNTYEIIVDKAGQRTMAEMLIMQQIINAIKELQSAVDDHETRITALEP